MWISKTICVAAFMLFAEHADAVGFEPKVADICSGTSSAPSTLVLDRRRFLGLLFEKQGLSLVDLGFASGDVSYTDMTSALLDPDAYCRSRECPSGVVNRLGTA